MELEEYERITDAAVSAFLEEHFRSLEHAPPILWQYTDLAGLQGILTNRRIWATHIRFLNDPNEGLHTLDLLRERFEREDQPAGVRFLSHAIEVTRAGTYLACFSSDSDRLSQWRAYARDGEGFAIGMDLRAVPSHEDVGVPQNVCGGPFVVRVEYDARAKDRAFDALFDIGGMRMLPEPLRRDPKFQAIAAGAVLRMAHFCAVTFKHQAYEEEQEWRLVWLGPCVDKAPPGAKPTFAQQSYSKGHPDLPLRFRPTKYGLAPYLDWRLEPPSVAPSGNPPGPVIKQVVLGPKSTAETAFAIPAFLDCTGHDVEIRKSEASYR
ncbi:DUF2971 domain-containing protein [Sandaracinus amylolyticus]|uniref:DUF2971 domain-containing protein n=1 Tax=Sandaracinus amylolyticus TaxID=927083 RepID=A0A0F6SGH0_9BACT|nr:DUF2971 domain-containing protein [Sandaracinus amylolyticus]AKF08679.1 hypothetical protein DB32_005828 [Sandaracinus amylolyticus]